MQTDYNWQKRQLMTQDRFSMPYYRKRRLTTANRSRVIIRGRRCKIFRCPQLRWQLHFLSVLSWSENIFVYRQ